MAPTTLVTFRIRAPAGTNSLRLYGSWDNFDIGYQMSKDLQQGSEYWTGCFNFSNVICDGKPSEVVRSRSGGLKMGGTYWYFYKINDDTDFHNVCERATTSCPLMPGQLVNVLNVPYAFSSSRSRDPSTSSTDSEQRTMNPSDKFENPRPVPAKPQAMRLSTSPTSTEPFNSEIEVARETPNTGRFLRLAKKGSVDSYATTSPSGGLAGGLRAAFKLRTARSKSPESKTALRVPDHRRDVSRERRPRIDEDLQKTTVERQPRALLLRSASDESIHTLSFGQHRRRLSQPTTPIDNQDLTRRQIEPLHLLHSNVPRLETLEERKSSEIAIDDKEEEMRGFSTALQLDLEKRLPTLPNTPSSAYPASLYAESPPHKKNTSIDQLDSHFSATTIDTEYHPMSMVNGDKSHFSAWTTTTTDSVHYHSNVPLPDDHSRILALQLGYNSVPEGAFLPSVDSFSSINSICSTTPCESIIDSDTEFETTQAGSNGESYMMKPASVPQYSLPQDDYASQATLKVRLPRSLSDEPKQDFLSVTIPETQDNEILHSESMQQLLQELSYLSDMIQQ